MVTEKETVAAPVVKGLRDYELVLVVRPDIEEEKVDATIDSVSKYITARQGIIGETQKWGKRRLAYPIKHFIEGNYVLLKLKMKPATGKELEANLQISEEVIRDLLVKME